MIKYIIDHPWLLALVLPTILASIPSAIVKIQKIAVTRLLAAGDEIDQKAIRATLKVWVLWAEEKGAKNGPEKFAAVDKIIARGLPFLTPEQRKTLIESVVKEMDDEANNSLK